MLILLCFVVDRFFSALNLQTFEEAVSSGSC